LQEWFGEVYPENFGPINSVKRRIIMCAKLIRLISVGLVLAIAANASAELVGHWKLDGNLDDAAGSANGTFTGGTPGYGAGMVNQSLLFDGADDYLELPLAPSPTVYTISAWLNPASTDAASIIARTSGSGTTTNWSHQLRINSSGVFEHYTWDGSARTVTGTTAVEAGAWYFVAAIATNGGDVRLYVNGQEEGTATTVGTLWAAGDRYHVGSSSGNAMGWLEGMVDDIRIYDHELTEVEILSAMAGEVWPYAWGPNPADGAMLEATWTNLAWSPGGRAVSHDVYLSDNFNDVNDGAEAAFQGNKTLTDTMLIVGFFGFPFPDGLVPGTTYYWRIDEVNDAEPNSPWKGDVWSFWVPPKKAYEARPADEARFVLTDVTLEWTAGFNAKLHTVYFGDNFDEVNNASEGAAQTDPTFAPGALEPDKTYYWRVDELDPPATHKGDVWSFTTVPEIEIADPSLVGFWKFDEVLGTTAVDWSGHGNHGTFAGNPQRAAGKIAGALQFDGTDDYVEVPDSPSLDITDAITIAAWIYREADSGGWERIISKSDSSLYDYWLQITNGDSIGGGFLDIEGTANNSLDLAAGISIPLNQWTHLAYVYDGTIARGYVNGQLDKSENIGSFTIRTSTRPLWVGRLQTSYNFHGLIDEARIYNRALTAEEILLAMRGDLLLAWNPDPANGSTTNIGDAIPLTWSRGDNVSEHAVYFGTDRDAVGNADASDTTGVYRGRQTVTGYSPPEGVEWGGGPYYWRIDEHNTDATVTKGQVWNFTVADYLTVDDFESYDDIDPAPGEPGLNRIFDKWIDGYGNPLINGAIVGNPMPPYAERIIVHSGSQSLNYSYDNFNKTSEATLTLVYPRDWTEQGVTKLSLWLNGSADNAADRIYVALNGTALVYHDDPAATQITGWTEWVIDLAAFGVNLTNVNTITIGVGTKNVPNAGGGQGMLYFDDIRLYR